jgi:hypothetical protein
MDTFLRLIGATVLILVVGAVLAGLFFFLKLRRLIQKSMVLADAMGGVVPKVSAELNIVSDPKWFDAKAAERYTRDFIAAGYVQDGDFEVLGMKDSYVRGFVHPDGRSMASISSIGRIAQAADIFSVFHNDEMLTVSNTDRAPSQTPPFRRTVRMPGEPVSKLVTAFEEAFPTMSGEHKIIDRGDFKRHFEEGYRRQAEWHYASGSVDLNHIEVLSEMSGRTVDPETKEFLRGQGYLRDEKTRQTLVEAYLTETKMLALEWERIEDRVDFVTDNLPYDGVMQIIKPFTELEAGELRKIADRAGVTKGRDLFWTMVTHLGIQSQFERVYELQTPQVADVILLKK